MATVEPRLAVLLVTLLGFGLRVYGLHHQSFWLDEVDAIATTQEPVSAHLRKFLAVGENGPLYFVLFKGWVALAGTTEFGARYLSAAASTATVPLMTVTAWRLFRSWPVSLVATLLAASAPYYVWYGQDAKMYPIYGLLALAAQYCFLRAWDDRRATEQGTWRWWVGYVACSSLALYVHLFAALHIVANTVAGAAWWLWSRRKGSPISARGFLVASAALIGPYVPLAAWQLPVLLQGANVGYRPSNVIGMLVTLLQQFTWHLNQPVHQALVGLLSIILLLGLWRAWDGQNEGASLGEGMSANDGTNGVSAGVGGQGVRGDDVSVAIAAVGLGANGGETAPPPSGGRLGGGNLGRRRHSHGWRDEYGGGAVPPPTILLLIWLVVPLVILAVVQARVPVFRDRYLFPLAAPFLLTLACATTPPLTALSGRLLNQVAPLAATMLAALVVSGSMVYGLAHRPPNPDFRAAARFVMENGTPQDYIGFIAGYAERPFRFYLARQGGRYQRLELPYTNYPDYTEQAGLAVVARSLRAGRAIWIVRFEDWLWDSRDRSGQYLANRGVSPTLRQDFNGVSLTRYPQL